MQNSFATSNNHSSGRRGNALTQGAAAGGWPSPAQDYYSGDIDLNDILIKDRDATFIVRVDGDSMLGSGISHNDEVVVDRSISAKHGDVVIAVLNDELLIRRLDLQGSLPLFRADNPKYPAISPTEFSESTIWGVVTFCLHHVR